MLLRDSTASSETFSHWAKELASHLMIYINCHSTFPPTAKSAFSQHLIIHRLSIIAFCQSHANVILLPNQLPNSPLPHQPLCLGYHNNRNTIHARLGLRFLPSIDDPIESQNHTVGYTIANFRQVLILPHQQNGPAIFLVLAITAHPVRASLYTVR
jgi:hypothetical protein